MIQQYLDRDEFMKFSNDMENNSQRSRTDDINANHSSTNSMPIDE